MQHLKTLWQLIGGHRLPEEDEGPARRTQIIVMASFVSAILAAVYGAALAGGELPYLLANLYRMPLVVLLASAFTLPAALLAWRICGTDRPPSDLALGLAAGTLTGTLVLAVMSPIVALYAHTSTWMGPVLALGTALVGLMIGLGTTGRAVLVRAEGTSKLAVLIPLTVVGFVHLATLTQLISVSSLMPETTFLDDGLEGLANH